MTKKDYIALAKLINGATLVSQVEFRDIPGKYMTAIDKDHFVNKLCGFLKSDNPNFDEVKFRKAIS
jgi:hypothetical protein